VETSAHPTWMGTAEVGERLGISQRSVWGLIHSGWLPAFKFAGLWVVDRPGVEDLAAARKTASAVGGHREPAGAPLGGR
jgi:hypothetical protein